MRPVLSCQLYSCRHAPSVLDGIEAVRQAGFAAVEPFDALYADAEGLARQLAAAGLAAPSGHVGLALLDHDLPRVAALARRLGIETVVMPYLPPEIRPENRAGWRAMGDRLGALARRLDAEGLRFAYHNHDFEFHPLTDGTLPIEHVLGEDLLWEADVAWIIKGGADPAAWLARYRGRVPLVHVKDIAPPDEAETEDGWADVGTGLLDWAALWPLCRAAGAGIMVAEHDNPADLARFATRSFATMDALSREEP